MPWLIPFNLRQIVEYYSLKGFSPRNFGAIFIMIAVDAIYTLCSRGVNTVGILCINIMQNRNFILPLQIFYFLKLSQLY